LDWINNIDKITEFIKTKLADLALTYDSSSLSQIRCLLGSIFLSGVTWEYPGCSNRGISLYYQYIRDIDTASAAFGDPSGNRTRDFRDESP